MNDHLSRIALRIWEPVPDFPLWIRMCVGDSFLSKLGLARPRDHGALFWNDAGREDIQFVVERFATETDVCTSRSPSNDDLVAISSLDHLQGLECQYLRSVSLPRFFAPLNKLNDLRCLRLSTGDGAPIDDATMAQIARLSRLEELNISNGSALTEQGLAQLGKCSALKDLRLGSANLNRKALNRIGDLTQLRRLELWGSTTVDPDLSALSRMDSLEELCLGHTEHGKYDLRQLRSLHQLRYLNFGWKSVTPEGLELMVNPSADCPRPFENLKYLDTIGVEFKLAAVERLASLKGLEGLRVDVRQIDSDGIAALQKLHGLRRLDVTGMRGSGIPLGSSPTVLQLKRALPNCQIDESW